MRLDIDQATIDLAKPITPVLDKQIRPFVVAPQMKKLADSSQKSGCRRLRTRPEAAAPNGLPIAPVVSLAHRVLPGCSVCKNRSAIACAHGFQKVVTCPALATVTKFPLGNNGMRLRSELMSR